jgi:hypothetical protein
MKTFTLIAVLALLGCTTQPAKPVVILGNKTAPAVCDHSEAAAEHARAEKWKAYAEKLETELGIRHGGKQ